ncbi:hypothetical protein pipiens_002526 [Culex pipiens pipiens]|uniref:RNase H type-1 domain-containing protein n=1 Tax=Culex pipiens pipiens TaxID=38569 RepID=A0ABD1DCM3_CULPP
MSSAVAKQADAFVRNVCRDRGQGEGEVAGQRREAGDEAGKVRHQDEDGFVYVYTDGSCEGNGMAAACAGLRVYFGEEHVLNAVSGRATNNCGEFQAAALSIRLAKQQGIKRLTVNTDSRFLIDSITEWLSGWKRNAWKLSTGKPVKNQVDFEELDRPGGQEHRDQVEPR